MIKKIIAFLIVSASLNATVFDYRLNYGSATSEDDYILSYTGCVYNYFKDSDFALGAQGEITPLEFSANTSYLTSVALLGAYDFTRTLHGEINAGASVMFSESSYYTGYHVGGVFLIQTNLDTYMESLQFGISVSYDAFDEELIENEFQSQLFVGFGF